jgi:hypothetical protein
MAGYHCLMPKGIILRCVPMPNLLAFFFVAFSFPNNPISSHFIALTHNGGTKTKNVRGRESTGHSLLFIYVTARLFWQGDGN